MSKNLKENVEKYTSMLRDGEVIEEIALFRTVPLILFYLAVILIIFGISRIFYQYMAVLMFVNILSLLMMVDAGRAIYTASNSCLLVTNQRTIGKLGDRNIDLPHAQLKKVALNRYLLLDGGTLESCYAIKHMANKKQIYDAITSHCRDL